MKKGKVFLIFIPLLLLFVAQPVAAATLKGGEDVSVAKDQVVYDDLYIGGGNVTVLGNVSEDLLTAGGNILLNGGVGVDAIAAGGSVQILSPVGDDVRVAGGQVVIGDSVGGDVLAAGGDIKLLSSSVVAGDVVIAGSRVVLDGAVAGDVQIWADEVIINGSVSGNVTVKGARVTINDTAVISGDLTYSAPEAAKIADGATVSGVTTFDQMKQHRSQEKKGAGFLVALGGIFLVGKLFVTLLAALVLVLLFQKFSRMVSMGVLENYGKNALLGFAALIVTPFALILIAATLVGFLVAGIGFGVYALGLFLAKALVGIVAGALLSQWIKKEAIVDWKWAILGVVVVQVVSLIPFVGWIAMCLLFIGTFGALVSIVYQQFWVKR